MSIKVLVEQEGKKVSLEGEMDLLLAENLGNEKKSAHCFKFFAYIR
ncbi:hypothetical protein [Carboxydocella sp. JDF658]|nr:hypothetical protein [Carboxydocella sp. JDF658]